ncbi:MAG: hypothetical protein M1820_000727 [Bogoriella megaspora]|nr:MAG: hypothetical protein M1820_000727 [Bogoriella megaspora]
MSQYGDYDEPRRYRSTRTRPRERDEPEFVKEETYIERGHGPAPRDLVFRGRDDSAEDIQRDFPPPNSTYRKSTRDRYDYDDDYAPPRRRARSQVSRRGYEDDRYSEDSFDEYGAPAAAGAAAGYAAGRARRKKEKRRERRRSYYSEDDDYSPSPPRRERRKSGVGEVIEGLGLGGLAAKLAGKDKDDSRSRSRSRDRSRSKGRARSRRRGDSSDSDRSTRSGKSVKERKWAQAAQAALVAGAVQAFKSRKTPGPWTGEKGRRIATAAIGAGGIDGLLDRNPDKKSKRHLAEAVIGGLAANRLANGPSSRGRDRSPSVGARSRSRSIFGRSLSRGRGRSQSRGPNGNGGGGSSGIKELAAGGALAAAGKAIYDRIRSKSRGRGRSRSPSSDSEDDYVPSRRGRYAAARGGPQQSQYPESNSREVASRNNDDLRGEQANAAPARDPDIGAGSSSDSESSTDLEQRRKKMRGKELITAGLATIATIHAAHGVYNSMEASEKRHKLVQEGEMTAEEARKKRSKAWLQDAAAVGIAALGIKGAFSEWKEMNEQRHSLHELEKRKREQRKRREKRQKERRAMGFGGNYPMMGPPQGYQPPGQMVYNDGNPYGNGGVPPPPMGAPTPRY